MGFPVSAIPIAFALSVCVTACAFLFNTERLVTTDDAGATTLDDAGAMTLDGSSGIPAQAAAVGYTVRTFDSSTVGTKTGTLQSFNFFSNTEPLDAFTQNSDGTVTITGHSGDSYGSDLCTAAADASQPKGWRGIAFGGGFYVEARLSFRGTPPGDIPSGWPAFYANDIETMSGGYASVIQWRGQPSGYDDSVAIDVMDARIASPNEYAAGCHSWYGHYDSSTQEDVLSSINASIGAATFSSINKYGALWIPATSSKRGSLSFFFNDMPVGDAITWDAYDPMLPPPPVMGTSACSIIDTRHMAFIFGVSNPILPMTVQGLTVWQATGANNLTH